jgi:polyisoprenoid-binding protein YceI
MNTRMLRFSILLMVIVIFTAGCGSAAAVATPAPVLETIAVPTATVSEPPAVLPAEATPTIAEPAPEVELPQNLTTRYEIVPEQSQARYRVREQLASLSFPNDAVGMTDQISGSVTLLPDGSIDSTVSKFTVNLASLRTDSDRRDNFVRRNLLHTDQYPTAVFVPTRISGLMFPLPDSGEVSFELIGDMTIRDVTREVTWSVKGSLQDGQAVGQATIRFTFEDFNLTKPVVASVLSIEDQIDLEIDAVIRAADGD